MEPDDQESGITVQITNNFSGINISLSKLEKLIKEICIRFKVIKATISIAVVDDLEISKLNTQFLNKNSVTDCLSFDLSEEDSKFFELVVNGEMALRQAKMRGHDSQAELALYVTHSLLHQLGFDDLTTEQAKEMHKAENEILQQQGYNLMYN